ncbi:MAG: DNA-3-methyladenine glycosylase family protein [bacterium]
MTAPTGRRPRWWSTACSELGERDPLLATLIDRHPPMRIGSRGDAFQTLARSIVGQQISVKAAQSVWARFQATLACPEVAPAVVLVADPSVLRACGLSGRKVEYLRDLAGHFMARPAGVDGWTGMADAEIIEELTAIRGIGVWTVQMYLIFHLARPDVLPLADLGLRRAIERGYGNGRPAAPRQLDRLSGLWHPWRTAATWYLWRSLDPEPVLH